MKRLWLGKVDTWDVQRVTLQKHKTQNLNKYFGLVSTTNILVHLKYDETNL